MRNRAWLCLLAGLVAGCVTARQPPVPDAVMAAESRVKLETLKQGHAVYMNQCTRCHDAWLPEEISGKDWHVVVPGMAWNASISGADEEAVLAYILAARQVAR